MIKDALGKDDIEVVKFRKGSVIVDLKIDPELAKKLAEDKDFLNRLNAESMEIGESIEKKKIEQEALTQKDYKFINENREEILRLESGKEIEVETGVFSMGRVQGLVFHDLNGNGIFDPNEKGVQNIIVKLNRIDGITVSTTSTNSEGQYSFAEKRPGVYYISFELPEKMAFSPTIDTDLLTYSEDFKIITSDVNVDTGNSSTFSLQSGSNKTEINAGIFKYSFIKGIIFEDFDGDGIFHKNIDMKSIGIQNGFVEVYPTGSKELIKKVEITVDGDYEIQDLPPRSYRLKFILPNSYRISRTHPLTSSGIVNNVNNMGEVENIDVYSNSQNYINLGYYISSEISGFTWEDKMAEGLISPPYTPISNIKLSLISATTHQEIETLTSDNSGLFSFLDLPPDEYFIEVSLNPYHKLSPNVQKPEGDQYGQYLTSDVDIKTKRTKVFTIRSRSPTHKVSIGIYRLSSIVGYVWDDHTANGIFDKDYEKGIENIRVILRNSKDETVRETYTDSSGYYRFDLLEPGYYKTPIIVVPENLQVSHTRIHHGYDYNWL